MNGPWTAVRSYTVCSALMRHVATGIESTRSRSRTRNRWLEAYSNPAAYALTNSWRVRDVINLIDWPHVGHARGVPLGWKAW